MRNGESIKGVTMQRTTLLSLFFCLLLVPAATAQPTACSSDIELVEVNGTMLHYIACGESEPVVLVHGSLGDYRSWAGQVGPFSEQYRVISYSRRYHYPNPWPQDASSFSATVHANDLAAFIQALQLEDVHLVGHSYGALTALLVARDNPERVRSLTLGEPPLPSLGATSPEGDSLFQAFIEHSITPSRKAFERGNVEDGVRRFLNGVIGEGAYEQLPPNAHFYMLENARELKGEMIGMDAKGKAFFPTVTCEEAGTINIPTLIVDGERSPKMLRLVNEALARCLPNHDRVMIPGASHDLKIQEPPVFTKNVRPFLSKH
jgi:pimeloyl-ACP methyl ester carboxylesterase